MHVQDRPIDRLRTLIRQRIKQLNISQAQAARDSGLDPGTLSNIMTGKVVNFPTGVTLQALAKGLRLDVHDLTVFLESDRTPESAREAKLRQLHEIPILNNSLGTMSGDGSMMPITGRPTEGMITSGGGMPISFVRLPLYGPVSCGSSPSWSLDDAQETIPVPTFVLAESGAQAVFKVSGDSMSAERIADGEHVLVRPYAGHERPQPGDIVIVETEGGYVCKMFQKNLLGAYLESRYAGRDPEPWKPADDARIVGLVLGGVWYDTRKRR